MNLKIDMLQRVKAYWDDVFGGETNAVPAGGDTGNDMLNRGLDWLCDGAHTLLDFGCGNGSLLFRCAYRGTRAHIGIDLSAKAIARARETAEGMPPSRYRFVEGGVEALAGIEDGSADGIILSNIVDNVDADDAICILEHAHRIARSDARLFIKMNPYLSAQQIADWNIKVVHDDLLDDGLLLLNMPDERWLALFDRYFRLYRREDVYFQEYDQINRLFLLRNRVD